MGRLLVLLLSACSVTPSAPAVRVDADPSSPVLAGVRAWEAIGFTVSDAPSGLPPCPPMWWVKGDVDCELVVEIVRYPMLVERYGTEALTDWDTETIAIDARLDGDRLQLAAAHESGHLLLRTKEHTQGGIMGGSSLTVTAQDRALACRTVGLGC